MSERSVSRPWSEEEDKLLRQAVEHFTDHDNWKNVASMVPGRTNKACRKRWLHSLKPDVKKTSWTKDEDELLLRLYKECGPKWSAIARQIPGRTDDACSKRYREALDPNLKKDEWTPEEDQHLLEAYTRLGGGKWGKLGNELNRSGLGCRNRYRLLGRRKGTSQPHISTTEQPTQPQGLVVPENDYSHSQSSSSSLEHWPPYYPPEAYPTFTSDVDPYTLPTFHEPAPSYLDIPDPKVAPFKFSSSSLSAALSDPPRKSAPLPPISLSNTPELVLQDIPQDSDRQPSLSPLSQCDGIPEMHDILMSQPIDYSQERMEANMNSSLMPLTADTLGLVPFQESNIYSASPIIFPGHLSNFNSFSKPRSAPEIDYENSPRSTIDNRSNDGSSTLSTPYPYNTPLSPNLNFSPMVASFADLPGAEPPSSTSLLFSSSNDSQSSLLQRTRKPARKSKPSMKTSATTRLSSMLVLDPSLRPYACNRPSCWPSNREMSSNCFSTSGELLEHAKQFHPEDEVCEKPYRCALQGCEKSWKSINGLQYHLQISTAHFTHALFSRFSAQQMPATPDQIPLALGGEEGEDNEQERRFPCPEPGCLRAYRQTSGLRYHVKHGHPRDMPKQLDVVPPALERVIPMKAKKLRAKPPPSEPTAV